MYNKHSNQSRNRPFSRFNSNNKSRFQSRPSSKAMAGTVNRRGRGGGRKKFESTINISDFIKKASIIVPEKLVTIKHASFAEFNLHGDIQKNLAVKKYLIPTPIQDQSIPSVMEGRDIIGLASTGTGKTAAFLLPLINKLLADRSQKVLIMAPTRELAIQIDREFCQFTFGMKMFSVVCVGGMPINRQINDLRYNYNFIIGTPGRLKDLADRGHIKYNQFQNVVLDEVDHMLDMGFIEPITQIMNALPAVRQTLFYSATMPPRIRSLASKFSKNAATFEIASDSASKNVEQEIVRVQDKTKKFDMLHEILTSPEFGKVLIFSETKRDVERLTIELQRKGHRATSIHGDKRQRERAHALAQFSNNIAKVLVATDVAARGLDIKDITHVINYTIPQTYDDYIHRIGRTGRGGSKGKALTFV
ncbi:MAG: DEAD/DEAH box helicase domain protein [Candidatus Nomurabacteria bacterium GW2011_GWB1_37_5]|uniref:DEAD/DEAH box helicase domain protein n=1 Tax=Candidatus Nomurabacteria bacterium GW2011_GWB1_37_5 TaxID=1618742 RepID=A0A0G0GTX1_9BACT|nr:MAG: DEAD/DEAH box helicase domain protein [Candidatus Nomurabacteria bacterium GW2011_GWB1_37_5]